METERFYRVIKNTIANTSNQLRQCYLYECSDGVWILSSSNRAIDCPTYFDTLKDAVEFAANNHYEQCNVVPYNQQVLACLATGVVDMVI